MAPRKAPGESCVGTGWGGAGGGLPNKHALVIGERRQFNGSEKRLVHEGQPSDNR